MQQEIHLRTHSDRSSGGLLASFAPKRTTIEHGRLVGLPDDTRLAEFSVDLRGIHAVWQPAVPRDTHFSLIVELQGELLEVAEVVWRTADGTLNEADKNLGPLYAALIRAGSLDQLESPARTWFRARTTAISKISNQQNLRFSQFFLDYDQNTHPVLLAELPGISGSEVAERTAMIRQMEPVLKQRVLMRAEHYCEGAGGEVPNLPSSQANDVQRVSGILLDVYRGHLGVDSVIDVDACWIAFERFSNGELRVPVGSSVWNGQPNSANHFSFAEFAFMAIELAIDQADWTALAAGLVASQKIFSAAYEPAQIYKPYFYEQYAPRFFASDKQVNDEFKGFLRMEFSGRNLAYLRAAAGRNAYDAFPKGSAERPNPCRRSFT